MPMLYAVEYQALPSDGLSSITAVDAGDREGALPEAGKRNQNCREQRHLGEGEQADRPATMKLTANGIVARRWRR